MAHLSLQPCGLGYQQRDLCHYVVATILSTAILLWMKSCPTQFLFYKAQERMRALLQQMAILAGNKVHLSLPGKYRMGLIQVKHWKQRKVGFLVGLLVLAWHSG